MAGDVYASTTAIAASSADFTASTHPTRVASNRHIALH